MSHTQHPNTPRQPWWQSRFGVWHRLWRQPHRDTRASILRATTTRLPLICAVLGVLTTCTLATNSLAASPLTTSIQTSPHDVDPELRQKLLTTIAEADSFVDRFDAEVWLVQKSTVLARFVKDPKRRLEILKEVHRAAHQVKIPPEFVLAVIQIESHFNNYAVSSVGAQGMMQVMPFWKKEIGREHDNLIDMATNLRYGCTILKHYLDRSKGNWTEALARYNGSYGKVKYPRKVLVVWEQYWR